MRLSNSSPPSDLSSLRISVRSSERLRKGTDMAITGHIVIIASAFCSPNGPIGVSYSWDGKCHAKLEDAITDGYHIRDSDDFNIGRVVSGKLIELTWMGKKLDEPKSQLRKIGAEIGLEKSK